MTTITCYRPLGEKELKLVAASGFTKWPPRLPEQPIFYPVTNEQYAIELTKWNITDFGAGYVSKFDVKKAFMDRYPIKCVGAKSHTEWWVCRCLQQLSLSLGYLMDMVKSEVE